MDKKGVLNFCFAALSAVGILGFVNTLDDKTIENLKKLKSVFDH
ncbi:hypothetical protein NSQ96_12910 [Caldifermentibacillus hisashii]|uniref:Uncharacterized protein n=1 Tax=Caldifermentibacillus hisashii TaxID=996558 RepID=A0ABU9K0A1_9BACI